MRRIAGSLGRDDVFDVAIRGSDKRIRHVALYSATTSSRDFSSGDLIAVEQRDSRFRISAEMTAEGQPARYRGGAGAFSCQRDIGGAAGAPGDIT
jgi:hypothetical protein